MKNGFLYVGVKFLLDNLRYLSIIEWLKEIGVKVFCKNPHDKQARINCRSNIVDGFTLFKWLLVIILYLTHASNSFLTFIVWYLIIANLYSYFYHHIWSDNAIDIIITSHDRARRRFFLLMLAFCYSELCFAYLYRIPYFNEFKWTINPTISHSLWFSVSNSLAANYNLVNPITELGNSISMIQLTITFIFVTIILSKSLPEINR